MTDKCSSPKSCRQRRAAVISDCSPDRLTVDIFEPMSSKVETPNQYFASCLLEGEALLRNSYLIQPPTLLKADIWCAPATRDGTRRGVFFRSTAHSDNDSERSGFYGYPQTAELILDRASLAAAKANTLAKSVSQLTI